MAKRKLVKVVRKGRTVTRTKVTPRRAKKKKLKRAPVVQTASLPHNAELVTLEDRQIATMLADPRFTAAIPCLKSGASEMKKVGKRCGRCNKKRSKARASIMSTARSCVARMPAGQKKALKALIGAKKVQVMVANGKKVQPVTF